MTSEMIGLIPAAGLGTRMGGELPKALVSVDGQTLLERAIASLQTLDVSKIVIVIGKGANRVREFIEARNFNVPIEFAFQERQLGLANAIAVAQDLISTDFVVLCPDNIFSDADDLLAAEEAFRSHRPGFLMVATVTPTHERDRAKYFSGSMKNLGEHLYEYRFEKDAAGAGLGMNSTGCTFFSRAALAWLPAFTGPEEVSFHTYLTQVASHSDCLLYMLRGMRYDFSSPADVAAFQKLQQQLAAAIGAGVSVILINQNGEVLMQHRDDNPQIRYPNHWALFGGSIEDGESAQVAARREILEETGYNIENLGLFREFVQNAKREFAFVGEITASLSELSLTEGQGMDFIRPSELPKLLIRPDDKETLKAYFGAWNE